MTSGTRDRSSKLEAVTSGMRDRSSKLGICDLRLRGRSSNLSTTKHKSLRYNVLQWAVLDSNQ